MDFRKESTGSEDADGPELPERQQVFVPCHDRIGTDSDCCCDHMVVVWVAAYLTDIGQRTAPVRSRPTHQDDTVVSS